MDLLFLRALYDRPGPFASVYLDMRRTEATRTVEVCRHVRCKELADKGAPPETIEAVERVVRDEKERREHRVPECQTPVFLWVEVESGKVHIHADVPP